MQPDRWTRCDSEVYATLADHNTSALTETPRPGSQGGSEPDPHLSSERTESHQNSNTTRTSIKDEVTGSCRWAEHISLYWLKVYYTASLHAAHHSCVVFLYLVPSDGREQRRASGAHYDPYSRVFKVATSSGCSDHYSCRGGSQEEIYKERQAGIRTGSSFRRLCLSHPYILDQKIQ